MNHSETASSTTERTFTTERTPLEPLKTINQVAELLGVSRSTVYRLIGRGSLTGSRVGEHLRFTPDEIRALIDRRERDGDGDSPQLSAVGNEQTPEEPGPGST